MRGELAVAEGLQASVGEAVECEMDFGATDVASENHLVKLQGAGMI